MARRSDVAPFIVMDVMQAAARLESTGVDVAHLEVGQPGAPAPRAAREAAGRALASGASMGYTVALGTPELRGRIAQMYAERGIEVSPERIIVTTGSSAAFLLSFLTSFDSGESVALAEPGYPSYRNILRSLDITPVGIPVGPETGYQLTPEALSAAEAAAGPVSGLLAASPANPTGVCLTRDQMQGLIEWTHARGATYISDEIYDGLYYGPRPVSALELTDQAIVINSFSKYHCMTGWRIGWMVVPEALIRPIERLAQNHFICPPHISQIAALAALDADAELSAHLQVYRRNRAALLTAAPDLGLSDLAPADGAFYIYGSIKRTGLDSETFCRRALAEAHTAITPGLDFDPVRGRDYVRLSYAGSEETVRSAVERLSAWVRAL